MVRNVVLFVDARFREGYRFRFRYRAVRIYLALDRDFNRVQVFALMAPFQMVRAGAGLGDGIDRVRLLATLRGNKPRTVLAVQLDHCRDDQAALLAHIHLNLFLSV